MAVIACQGVLKDPLGQADLCGPCARELLNWLRRGPAPGATPRIKPDGA
jgi:hypothetical protein